MTVVEELRTDRESGARRLESEYKAGLMTLARRFCADEGDAEELVNRTLAAVVEGIDDYLEQSAFFGWMCKILENVHAKDVRRKSNRTVVGDAEAVAGARDDDAGDRIFREVDASLLRDAIADLPPDMKEALMLRYFMDLPVSRVARILSAPEGTVKWRLHCARMMLAAKLGARSPGVRVLVLGLLLAAGLAIGGALYTLGAAVFGSHAENAESAEVVSHAENAESAESVSHAENAESAEPTSSTPSTPSTLSTVPTLSTPDSSEMNAKSILAASASLALAAAPAAADQWVYDSGTRTLSRGTVVLQNVSASGANLTIGDNRSNATATDLDFSVGVEGGYAITQIANNAFDQNKNVTNLVLPDTVTWIGQSAFYGCSNFKGELVLPDSLTSTGYHPFAETGITRLEFGSGMATVNNWFIRNNKSLRSVKWNDAITAINSQAFQYDSGITTFENDFPTNVTSIVAYAFDGALALTGDHAVIRLPKITSLGACAFQSSDFEGVEVGGTLVKLADAQFYAAKIRWAVVGDGVTEIGKSSFAECTSLTNLVFPATLDIAGPALRQNANGSQTMHVWWNSFPSTIDTGVNGFITAKGATVDHLNWNDRAAWEAYAANWTGDSRQQLTLPAGPFDSGTWGWAKTHAVYWHNQPIASVGGTDYTSLRAAMEAAGGSPITLLAPSVADFTEERVSLTKNESFAIVDDAEHTLGYLPGVPDSPGWKLAQSRQTWDGIAVVVYKAVGPGTIILVK